MFYHVIITQKSNQIHDEVKLDLTEEKLFSQFIEPYENGDTIIINGKAIVPEDLERIRITKTDNDSSKILPIVKDEGQQSKVLTVIPYDWKVAKKGKDITDEFIKGPPGYKKTKNKIERKEIKQSNEIFIVHGHDEITKYNLEIFLAEIGLEPIVLHRKPDEGMTIIEKIEKYSNVGYAFVLLTPDDVGCTVEEYKKEEKERKMENRARQNVIFELGYLVGRLGREKVCCIYKESTTLPTDISGLLYKKLTKTIDDIKFELIKELTAAGYEPKLKKKKN